MALTRRYDGEPIVRVEPDTSVELDVSVNGSCGETVGADVTATAYIEDIKYCPFCGEELQVMKRAMISQPMAGKTDEEIVEARDKACAALSEMGYEFVNTLFTDEWYSDVAMKDRGVVQTPLCYLAKSLENMSLCHASYFCKGWENARGCRIEHDAAVAYGLEVLYED